MLEKHGWDSVLNLVIVVNIIAKVNIVPHFIRRKKIFNVNVVVLDEQLLDLFKKRSQKKLL